MTEINVPNPDLDKLRSKIKRLKQYQQAGYKSKKIKVQLKTLEASLAKASREKYD